MFRFCCNLLIPPVMLMIKSAFIVYVDFKYIYEVMFIYVSLSLYKDQRFNRHKFELLTLKTFNIDNISAISSVLTNHLFYN